MDAQLFVIFGATGDLTRRKLMPALFRLMQKREGDALHILGVARSEWSDEEFRQNMREALEDDSDLTGEELEDWCEECLSYYSLHNTGDEHGYNGLRERIRALEEKRDLPGNRAFYLSLPPAVYENTVEQIGAAGLGSSPGWTRLVVEKPFGHDLESAQALNAKVHEYFDEKQVYRIDHYLGKDTVQNLLAFRFGNALFESVWDRKHVERVEVTVAETLGVGSRAGYYDDAGHLRDMVQNHLTQLICLVAMEPPSAFKADAIRREKVKVLDSVRPIEPGDVVLGQYEAGEVDGEPAQAYVDEEGVPDDSDTETFAALTLRMDNWRWQGVPFALRTGKRLPEKRTQITVHFRKAPVSLFENHQYGPSPSDLAPNVLTITLQPDEGFDLSFEVKRPGEAMELDTQMLSFRYEDAFGPAPKAYETLLHDVMCGDQTLFVRADEVEASWAIYTPLLETDHTLRAYPAGTWGPDAAEARGAKRVAQGAGTSEDGQQVPVAA